MSDNWDESGVPTTSSTATIDNGGTARVAASGAVANQLILGGFVNTDSRVVEADGGSGNVIVTETGATLTFGGKPPPGAVSLIGTSPGSCSRYRNGTSRRPA